MLKLSGVCVLDMMYRVEAPSGGAFPGGYRELGEHMKIWKKKASGKNWLEHLTETDFLRARIRQSGWQCS